MSPATPREPVPTVAIIGGGFTGAAVAWHMARQAGDGGPRILVFEPRAQLGAGLAYDTGDPVHRINVPAARMSLDPADPEGFARWLATTGACADDEAAESADGSLYPARRLFGAYVASELAPDLASGRIRHVRATIRSIERRPGDVVLTDETGQAIRADLVVIATSHPAPQAPAGIDAALAGHPRYVADATRPDALQPVRPDDRLLVIGNGLTAADVIASLAANGHRGPVLAISRRGLVSRGHAPRPQEPFGDFLSSDLRTAGAILKAVREAIGDARSEGVTWHAVLDAVRSQGQAIWQRLDWTERRRIVRHLRPFWDVHRFRIAPQVEKVLETGRSGGRIEHLAARLASVTRDGETIRAAIRLKSGEERLLEVDALVVTTGPAHGSVIDTAPHLAALARAGRVRPDPAGLGLLCDRRSRLVGRDGTPDPRLVVAGPLARGTFGELMGLPQVAEHARDVALEVLATLAEDMPTRRQPAA